MFNRSRPDVTGLVILALEQLDRRLAALEGQNNSEPEDSASLEILQDIQGDVHALHSRVLILAERTNALSDTLSEMSDSVSNIRYYFQGLESQLNRLTGKVESVVNRQATAEQLLDSVRMYAAERMARDSQTAEPDGAENGDSV